MIIDIHTHIFPDELAERAVQKLAEGSNTPATIDGTRAGLLESMLRAGVDKSAIMHIATKPTQARSINKWALSLSKETPELISFGTIHPDQENWREELAWLVENQFLGIKFHPDYQKFFVDNERIFPFYQAISDAGLIVLFHSGVDIGLYPPAHCPPIRLAKVLDNFPKMKIIAAHMGGYEQWDQVEKYLVGRNIYFDSSFSYRDMGAERMTALINRHGPERILFGTDSPWTDQAEEIAILKTFDLTTQEIDGVLGNNAAVLLGLCS